MHGSRDPQPVEPSRCTGRCSRGEASAGCWMQRVGVTVVVTSATGRLSRCRVTSLLIWPENLRRKPVTCVVFSVIITFSPHRAWDCCRRRHHVLLETRDSFINLKNPSTFRNVKNARLGTTKLPCPNPRLQRLLQAVFNPF